MKGTEIGGFKSEIESYGKTVNLIEGRIHQMGTYVNTRAKIAQSNKQLGKFLEIIQFKYETLSNTLNYINELWGMTKNYVNAAIGLFSDLAGQSNGKSIRDLTVVTSMGVGATLLGLFTNRLPDLTWYGFVYFAALVLIGYAVNKIMKKIYISRTYSIGGIKLAKDIKFKK